MAEKYAKVDPLQFEDTACDCRSVEYCSWIMEAVATGKPFRFMGNVYNDGYIDNLPKDSVEVPTFADDTGCARRASASSRRSARRVHDQHQRPTAHRRRRADRRPGAYRHASRSTR